MSKSHQQKPKSPSVSLLAAIAALTTVALIGLATLPWISPDVSKEHETSAAVPTGSAEPQQVANPKQPTRAAKVVLDPTDPFDTQIEQQRLLAELEESIAAFPNDPKLLYLAAVTYAEFLQTERAIELFEKSLARDTSDAAVFVAYSDLLIQIGRAEEAVMRLEAGRTAAGLTPTLCIALAKAYSQVAEPEKALALLGESTPVPEYAAAMKLELSRVQNQLQQFEQAEANARFAIENGVTDRAAYLELSTALMRQGKREQALEVRQNMPPIEQQVEPGEQKYQVWFRKLAAHTYAVLGSAFEVKGLYEVAEEKLRYSVAIGASSEESIMALVGLYRKQGRVQEAFQWQQTLATAAPDNLLHLVNLASLAAAVQSFEVAEQSLKKAVEIDDTGQAQLRLAQFLMGVGRPAEAVQTARQAVAASGSLDAYLVFIVTLQNQGDRLEAAQAFLDAKKNYPNAPELAGFQP